ncbi:hypothetical protein K493DRAFT_311296 [Basidiobolus meristosporus CBS 931.73]|uniref:Nudix hydrolase domain-containing protein n=1 Tax=Basidiobolus meristosporus CBS 931.73 TaxID=1314790 RepID=A0A1Y1Z2R6_9FUNG|nr:hypothetical protein K493DRAFT_311296 [Basidiobolus meristosporus CBS 931.73]|eukprot:ORY04592.1 hypothetical protein K493DRAFT_311296 [Basidiobolus meristosporus CBS 931.73]
MKHEATARTGRDKQIYDETGARVVAGCVPIDVNTKPNFVNLEWILPKGGWESDEDQETSAQRECWEEAGVKGSIAGYLGAWRETQKKQPCSFRFFELHVESLEDNWPEKHERRRKWATYEEALALVPRQCMKEAVRQCSLGGSQ